MVNDILLALDQNHVTVLTLLDLSCAFDTIDHSILIRRLDSVFWISGTALSWVKSYLTNRTQTIVIDDLCSKPTLLSFGVPQGSVLGPLLFVMYMQPLAQVIAATLCLMYLTLTTHSSIITGRCLMQRRWYTRLRGVPLT